MSATYLHGLLGQTTGTLSPPTEAYLSQSDSFILRAVLGLESVQKHCLSSKILQNYCHKYAILRCFNKQQGYFSMELIFSNL